MSAQAPSDSHQNRRLRRAGSGGSSSGGGRAKDYLHAVSDQQASLLEDKGNSSRLQEVKMKTGAEVKFDPNPSPVPGMKILIIRGVHSQIEAAIKLIREMNCVEATISAEAQTFWIQWVEAAFPDLDSRAYFLPPVYFNRVPMTRRPSAAGQDVLVLVQAPIKAIQPSQSTLPGQDSQSSPPATIPLAADQFSSPQRNPVFDSDVRDDAALQRVLFCVRSMSEHNKEVLVGISQLRFGQYLNKPCYSAAAAQLPLAKNFPDSMSKNRQGDFDVLLFHRHYGFVVCEVKAFGENLKQINMTDLELNNNIRKKLKDAVSQLAKAEAMLSHLVSDIAPGLRITKTIAFPNLTARQVQEALSGDLGLTQDLCRCLGTRDPADIAGLCLCSDQLSDPKTPWNLSSHVLRELGHWWQRRVAGAGPDSHMTSAVYRTLVARFCGPATTVSVPCTSPPRVSVKTLGQAVWCTGECYTAVITLFPEQLHLLNTAPPTLFVTGPPGTGKTVVLLLMAIEWLRCGHVVIILSTWWGSRVACKMLYHLLLKTVNTQLKAMALPSQLQFHHYEFAQTKSTKEALNELSQVARDESLFVIVDEAGPESKSDYYFQTFCDELLTRVSRLHLWAASCYQKHVPKGWPVEYLTRPLRFPPSIIREVNQDEDITKHCLVQAYNERGVPDHTDGPPVRRVFHQRLGHSDVWPGDCITCGREVASFLCSLRAPEDVSPTTVTSSSRGTPPPGLQWRDVLVLYYWEYVRENTGMAMGLREAGIPVRVLKHDNDEDIEDVATARSDVVWVAYGHHVRGLERKVAVCLQPHVKEVRLHFMSRCTSQLVIVSSEH